MMRWLLVAWMACVPEGKPPLHNASGALGAACGVDSDCVQGLRCMTGDFIEIANLPTPGGYCTRGCTGDADCGGGNCVPGANSVSFCVAACNDSSSCRADYSCWSPGYCEPTAFLNCDADVAACTTNNNVAGGCIRYALGSGTTGVCRARCTVGNSICNADFACLFFDESPDPFVGTACWPVPAAPIAEGAACHFLDDCVKGAECVKSVCRRLCNPKQNLNCPSGTTCQDVYQQLSSTTSPVGACL